MSQDKKEEVKKEEVKKEEKAKPADPLEGKSIDELKEMIRELQNTHTEDIKKVRGFTVMLQGTSMKLKELGIDLGMIGRNTDQMLDAIMNNKLPQNIVDRLT